MQQQKWPIAEALKRNKAPLQSILNSKLGAPPTPTPGIDELCSNISKSIQVATLNICSKQKVNTQKI